MPLTFNNLPFVTKNDANNLYVSLYGGSVINCQTNTTTGLVITTATSQSVDALQIKNSSGNVIFSINASGSIINGSWQGSIISAKYGGTGLGSYDRGDIIYYNYGDTFGRLPISPTNYVLVSTGKTPEWKNSLILDEGLTVNYQSSVKFADTDGSNYIAFQAPANLSGNMTYTWPNSLPASSGYMMHGNPDGTMYWASGGGGGASLSSGSVTSGYIGNGAVVSGSIASGAIGPSHFASGSLFQILNPADNRIITSLASGTNQAYAENNLTYDGSKLEVTSISYLELFLVL
jgi:hypothetical protein